jgi:hypothetical protein
VNASASAIVPTSGKIENHCGQPGMLTPMLVVRRDERNPVITNTSTTIARCPVAPQESERCAGATHRERPDATGPVSGSGQVRVDRPGGPDPSGPPGESGKRGRSSLTDLRRVSSSQGARTRCRG